MRKQVIFSVFLLAVLSFALPAPAQTGSAAAAQVTEFEVNGLKVIVKRRPGAPTVAGGLFFKGGSRNLTAPNAGIENFALRAASEGSKLYPTQKLRKETARIGSSIGASSNFDYSVLAFSTTRENLDATWKMFVDVALNPAFVPADVERVREQLLTGLRMQADAPEGALESLTERVVYAGHPYAISPEGTIQTISSFRPADLATYHRGLLQTSRMLLVVVGDIEPESLRPQVSAAFGTVARGEYKDAAPAAVAFSQGTVDVVPRSLPTNYVRGTFAAPPVGHPDYYAMRTAITILQTAVFQEVRVRRNLSYAPDAELRSLGANTGAISVSSVNPNEAVRVMMGEVRKLREQPVEEAMLASMASYFLTTHFLKLESNAAQAAELALYELTGGGWRNSVEFLDRMRKVKPAEVQAVANKYMRNVRFTVVGNPAAIDKAVFLQN